MLARPGRARRPGLTLLEVLVSLAIFLFALVGITRLINLATDQAREVQWQSRATRLAQSKLNEVIAGVQPISSGGSGTFDEEPDWQWSIDSESDSTAQNLWKVTVRVWREHQDSGKVETTLAQYVVDPAQRGGVTQQDASQQSTDSNQSSPQSGSSGSSSSAGNSSPQPSTLPPTTRSGGSSSPPATTAPSGGGNRPAGSPSGGGGSGTGGGKGGSGGSKS